MSLTKLEYITCHLSDAFIQNDFQLIRLSRSNVGLRALLKGPTAVQILSWPHQGSNHRPCGSKSSTLTPLRPSVSFTMDFFYLFITKECRERVKTSRHHCFLVSQLNTPPPTPKPSLTYNTYKCRLTFTLSRTAKCIVFIFELRTIVLYRYFPSYPKLWNKLFLTNSLLFSNSTTCLTLTSPVSHLGIRQRLLSWL